MNRFRVKPSGSALSLAALLAVAAAGPLPGQGTAPARLTAREVTGRIRKNLNVRWQEPTVDVFKAGDPDTPVTGIATTFTASYDVLRRAAASGKNFVISHEPIFYNHLDQTKALEDDPVYQAKLAFIKEHKMVVWRFHDHIHRHRPDNIVEGAIDAMGWRQYQRHGVAPLFTIPETTVRALAADLKARLRINAIRVIGDPNMKVTQVGFQPGAPPAAWQMQMLARKNVDVLVAGETREWETVEYARDAAAEGLHKALIILGHLPSEEPGMQECARWLRAFITEVPIEFIPAGEPFWIVP